MKMKVISHVSFLILFAISSQKLVLASDHRSESSPNLHTREERMQPSTSAPPGTSPSHQLSPFLAYNLHTVNIEAPTVVVITRNKNIFGTGYAIHPFLVLTASVFARPQYVTGVSTRYRHGEGHIHHLIQRMVSDPTGEYVLIQLITPIFLDEPVHGAFPAAKVPVSATNWAYHQAMTWISELMSALRPTLRQNLNEVNFLNPAKVHVMSSERPSPGNGFAVHPYVVITRPEFVSTIASILSFQAHTENPRIHRIQFVYSNRALNVSVFELLDPFLLTNGVNGALTAENYTDPAIEWVRFRVEEWKRTRLNQRNYFHENAA